MTRIRTFLLTAMSRPILRRATGLLFLGFPGLAFIDQSCVAVRLSQSEVHVAIYSFSVDVDNLSSSAILCLHA